MNILSMDFGTSSVKLAVIDGSFSVMRTARVPYGIRIYNGDWAELDGEVIFRSMIEGIRSLGGGLEGIGLIAYDTFSPSMMFMDRDGKPVYPVITHLDRRSKKQTTDILRQIGKDPFRAITGIQPFTGGASVTSVLWMMEHEPEIFGKIFRLGHLNTYIYRQLTGCWYSDPVNASMTGMYETISGTGWSEEICGILRIPLRLLPDITEPGSVRGYLTAEIADQCGLRSGIPVAFGTNDAAAAQAGAGNSESGDVLNISGSSEMISVLTEIPKHDDRYYLRCSATAGLWQIYATTAGGFALDWFRREFYRDMDEGVFFREEFPRVVEEYLETTKVAFLPYLAGDRQSLEPKKGGFTGLTLDTRREEFLAAMLIGMHEPIRQVIRICETFMPLNRTIKITGGMIDPAFLQVKERLFGGYRFKTIPDCPIIGSARLAAAGLDKEKDR